MRICKIIATKRIIGMTSDGAAGTLIERAAVEFGLAPPEIEELEVDDAGYLAALAEDPVVIAEKQAVQDAVSFEAAKLAEIADNLPAWQQVSDAIDGVTTIAGLKVVVKKIARIVYLLAKNQAT